MPQLSTEVSANLGPSILQVYERKGLLKVMITLQLLHRTVVSFCTC